MKIWATLWAPVSSVAAYNSCVAHTAGICNMCCHFGLGTVCSTDPQLDALHIKLLLSDAHLLCEGQNHVGICCLCHPLTKVPGLCFSFIPSYLQCTPPTAVHTVSAWYGSTHLWLCVKVNGKGAGDRGVEIINGRETSSDSEGCTKGHRLAEIVWWMCPSLFRPISIP